MFFFALEKVHIDIWIIKHFFEGIWETHEKLWNINSTVQHSTNHYLEGQYSVH